MKSKLYLLLTLPLTACTVLMPGVAQAQHQSPDIDLEITISQAAPDGNVEVLRDPNLRKLKVAVLDFSFGSSSGGFSSFSGGTLSTTDTTNIARGVSDMLADRLIRDGRYSVVERSILERSLQSQNTGSSSASFDPALLTKLGGTLGLDGIIVGTITKFDVSVRESGFNILGIGSRKKKVSVEVQLNARLISIETGETLATSEGSGKTEEEGSGFSIDGLFASANDTSNAQALVSKATNDAIDNIIKGMDGVYNQLAALPPPVPSVESIVSDVFGRSVILNRGSSHGYRRGMRISIERLVREVKDPQTGAVIRRVTQPAAMLELTEVDEVSSVGVLAPNSNYQPKVGDIAKPIR